jgi:hypothetical protein
MDWYGLDTDHSLPSIEAGDIAAERPFMTGSFNI